MRPSRGHFARRGHHRTTDAHCSANVFHPAVVNFGSGQPISPLRQFRLPATTFNQWRTTVTPVAQPVPVSAPQCSRPVLPPARFGSSNGNVLQHEGVGAGLRWMLLVCYGRSCESDPPPPHRPRPVGPRGVQSSLAPFALNPISLCSGMGRFDKDPGRCGSERK